MIPKTVNGPVISWSRSGICIPELSLEELATWIVEAARVWDGSGVGTAHGKIKTVLRMASNGMLRILECQLGYTQGHRGERSHGRSNNAAMN